MFFVRTAAPRDAEAIRELLVLCWRDTYTPLHGPEVVEDIVNRWHTLEAIKANIACHNAEMLIADDGRELGGIGFAVAGEGGTTIHLKQLYVHPAHRGQGIGRDLFAELETCFPAAQTLQLEVDARNGRAVAFYAAHGMTVSGKTDTCGGDSAIPALIMSKHIAGHE